MLSLNKLSLYSKPRLTVAKRTAELSRAKEGDFGVGLTLYFEILRILSLSLFLCFVAGLPLLVFSIGGGGNAGGAASLTLERTTLGACISHLLLEKQVNPKSGALFETEKPKLDETYLFFGGAIGLRGKVVAIIFPLFDLLGSIGFFFAINYHKRRVREISEKIEDKVLNLSDYSLCIQGFTKMCGELIFDVKWDYGSMIWSDWINLSLQDRSTISTLAS